MRTEAMSAGSAADDAGLQGINPALTEQLHLSRDGTDQQNFFCQAEDGIRDHCVTGVQTCALPISKPQAGVLLAAERISATVITELSFEAHAGEIIGFAGLIGSGREELPYLLCGARPFDNGRIIVRGQRYSGLSPTRAIDAGLGFIPSDRKRESAMPLLSVRENLTLPRLARSRFMRWLG